ncbi:MAG TPA: hypothetical protein VNL16_08550 [Chloroflexota bacterium]|nr:hypothetical protein [Chloroflexota bacterium]
MLRLGARLTAGVRHPSAPDLDLTVPYCKMASVRLRLCAVMHSLGVPPGTIDRPDAPIWAR